MTPEPSRLRRAMVSHVDCVWRVLRRCGLDDSDAEEAAQDVFMILARRLLDVPPAAERAFLASAAWRIASERRRASARRRPDPSVIDTEHEVLDVDEQVALLHARRLLDEALDALSEEQRGVFVLCELEELTAPQAAEVLEIPVGTVASRLRSARANFDRQIRQLRLRGERAL